MSGMRWVEQGSQSRPKEYCLFSWPYGESLVRYSEKELEISFRMDLHFYGSYINLQNKIFDLEKTAKIFGANWCPHDNVYSTILQIH